MSKAKSVVYSDEKAKLALAKKEYIKLGDKRGTLKLTGAAQKWKTEPTFTYVSSLRVAGLPADIKEKLTALGYTAADVKTAIADGYTAKSVERADYLAELAELKGVKKVAAKASPTVLNQSIAYYAEALEKAVASTKSASPKKKRVAKKSPKKAAKKASSKKSPKKAAKKASSKKSPKKAAKKVSSKKASPKKAAKSKSKSPKKATSPKGKTQALGAKVDRLKEGKVMDVSGFTAKDQVAKVIDVPGLKSKKIVVGRLASDKKNGIKAAAKALGDESLVERWEAAKAAKEAKGSPKARKSSPRKSASKKSSPAATLPLSPSNSPRAGGLALPSMPVARVPTIGSPSRSPRSPRL